MQERQDRGRPRLVREQLREGDAGVERVFAGGAGETLANEGTQPFEPVGPVGPVTRPFERGQAGCELGRRAEARRLQGRDRCV